MDNILEKLFESTPKIRVLRLLMQNSDQQFSLEQISSRAQVKPGQCRKELDKLLKIKLAKTKIVITKEKIVKKGKNKKKNLKYIIKTRKTQVFWVNREFEIYRELRELIAKSSVASHSRILKQLKKIGRVKLAILSGVLINHENSRTDILIVGDDITKRKLENFLANTESELGKSIQYTLMETDEFKYRLGMYDRFLRDILEYPHEKLINKLDI